MVINGAKKWINHKTRKKVSVTQQNSATENKHEEHLSNSRNIHQTIKTCLLQANMFCAIVEPGIA
jgi:alpha-acetolactate decarboxylase